MKVWYTKALGEAENQLRNQYEHCTVNFEMFDKDRFVAQFKCEKAGQPAEMIMLIIINHDSTASIMIYNAEYVRGWTFRNSGEKPEATFHNKELQEFAKDLSKVTRYAFYVKENGAELILCDSWRPLQAFTYANSNDALNDKRKILSMVPGIQPTAYS